MNSFVKAHEFFSQMQAGNKSFRLLNSNIDKDRAILKGVHNKTRLREGLQIHYSDVTNLCDLQTETEAPPHLGIKLFFEGGVSASIGNHAIPMPVRQVSGRWTASATLFHQREPELFTRRAEMGDRVRKLTIKILPSWLESGDVLGDASASGLKQFMSKALSSRSWTPSTALLGLAEQIIRPPALEPHLARLYLESRVLSIIAEGFSLLRGGIETPEDRHQLSPSECKRLRKAEELIKNSVEMLSVDEIARDVGISVNGLQRLFHAGQGISVFNYVRMQKLAQARSAMENEGLPIAQAAHLAGYKSAANFATAFKRQYGFTPKQSRR